MTSNNISTSLTLYLFLLGNHYPEYRYAADQNSISHCWFRNMDMLQNQLLNSEEPEQTSSSELLKRICYSARGLLTNVPGYLTSSVLGHQTLNISDHFKYDVHAIAFSSANILFLHDSLILPTRNSLHHETIAEIDIEVIRSTAQTYLEKPNSELPFIKFNPEQVRLEPDGMCHGSSALFLASYNTVLSRTNSPKKAAMISANQFREATPWEAIVVQCGQFGLEVNDSEFENYCIQEQCGSKRIFKLSFLATTVRSLSSYWNNVVVIDRFLEKDAPALEWVIEEKTFDMLQDGAYYIKLACLNKTMEGQDLKYDLAKTLTHAIAYIKHSEASFIFDPHFGLCDVNQKPAAFLKRLLNLYSLVFNPFNSAFLVYFGPPRA